ncbi:MAG: UDP-N-acetylglucosamine 4,6-dehydratase (inverting) [Magnetococcales bacterium]|nr:UDP-N-acetylglucosamine 4,6-dehydratase (inverting) [Magnetococcales bacterium]MBF0157179.1 UDP-N-acetylglucosamine 4,6-dehydratase (inverting) [Magnetococcales bacterium]
MNLDGKSVLVTGGTGSFGRQFIRLILTRFQPRKVVVVSRDEMKQWEMQQDPLFSGFPQLRFLLGDVRDITRLELAFREVDVVVHAAALKQVPAAEYNPLECIHTNILGAENVVRAALGAGVGQVIALSTDKAASPINLYGASKLAADKIFVAANNLSGTIGTRFSTVRYGNVVGSRGSVIPFFRRLVREGAASLPITDPRMTRFWITLAQGTEFVLSCLGMMRGGEIFVPKIPSMRVVELAEVLAPGIPHRIVGVRPGEKLHEVMITEDDARTTVALEDRYVIEPTGVWWTRRSFLEDGAGLVGEGFRYSSDGNDRWLGREELLRMLGELDRDGAAGH